MAGEQVATVTRRSFSLWSPLAFALLCLLFNAFSGIRPTAAAEDASHSGSRPAGRRAISIDTLEPDSRGGRAYRLDYRVDVPIGPYWRFKTDFDNDFLLRNKYIREHRVVSRNLDTVITENKYAIGPDVALRWRTTVSETEHRLDFVLLNAAHCGQRFHYGFIQLHPDVTGTRVVQVAYFDFLGAGLWAGYPWGGGMTEFLRYTAEWEQDLALTLSHRYAAQGGQ